MVGSIQADHQILATALPTHMPLTAHGAVTTMDAHSIEAHSVLATQQQHAMQQRHAQAQQCAAQYQAIMAQMHEIEVVVPKSGTTVSSSSLNPVTYTSFSFSLNFKVLTDFFIHRCKDIDR